MPGHGSGGREENGQENAGPPISFLNTQQWTFLITRLPCALPPGKVHAHLRASALRVLVAAAGSAPTPGPWFSCRTPRSLPRPGASFQLIPQL